MITLPLGKVRRGYILHFVKNKIQRVPEKISHWNKLRELALARNDIRNLPEVIGELSNLRELSLSRNPLTSLPETFGQL